MPSPVLVLIDQSVDRLNFVDALEFCRSFATYLRKPLDLGVGSLDSIEAAGQHAVENGASLATIEPRETAANAQKTIAEFIRNEDGSPNWVAMWVTYAELALYGGPSARSVQTAINPPTPEELENRSECDAVAEIQRGILETTGLDSEPDPDEPGWLKVYTYGPKMAAWLAASMILENVSARSRDDVLYVPASPHFTLEDQVRSIINVVAKTNHYWQEHITQQYANGFDGHFH